MSTLSGSLATGSRVLLRPSSRPLRRRLGSLSTFLLRRKSNSNNNATTAAAPAAATHSGLDRRNERDVSRRWISSGRRDCLPLSWAPGDSGLGLAASQVGCLFPLCVWPYVLYLATPAFLRSLSLLLYDDLLQESSCSLENTSRIVACLALTWPIQDASWTDMFAPRCGSAWVGYGLLLAVESS